MFRCRPPRSGIAGVADALAILVGDESDVGAVVVPVDVPDVVEGDDLQEAPVPPRIGRS